MGHENRTLKTVHIERVVPFKYEAMMSIIPMTSPFQDHHRMAPKLILKIIEGLILWSIKVTCEVHKVDRLIFKMRLIGRLLVSVALRSHYADNE